MSDAHGAIGPLALFGALSVAMASSPCLARPDDACLAAVNAAAQQAVANSPWIGQANPIGTPFVLRPGVLRASVGLFGPQSAFFSVDVGIDAACNVRSTSIRPGLQPVARSMKSVLPIAAVLLVIFAVWYLAAVLMNAPLQRDTFANADRTDYSTSDLVVATLNMERPKLPAPHQIVGELYKLVFATSPTSKRSLVYHGFVTLQETLIGFVIGAALGIALAVMVVSIGWLERSAMPWVVASQTIPIIALAPMIVVILNQFNITGVAPKAAIAAYLCFFPITVGMVKGFRSPEPLQLDLMRTYSATRDADLPEVASARERAVLLRQHEDRRGGGAGRRDRRRSDQERGRRHRRAPARRLLLWPDRPDLGGLFVGAALSAVLVGLIGYAGRAAERRMGFLR